MTQAFRRCLFILGCALATACATDTPFYRLAIIAPDTVTLSPGETVPVEITLNRTGSNQTGEISVSLETAPAGVTLEPELVLPAGEEIVTGTSTLSVPADVGQTGVFRTQLVAQDPTQELAAIAILYIAILPPPSPQPDFSIAVEPRQADIIAGASARPVVTVTRAEGFTGAVTLTLEDAPTRRIAAEPVTLTADQTSAEFRITTEPGVTRLPVILTIVGTSEDGRRATTPITLNIRNI